MSDPVEPFRAMAISARAHELAAQGRSIIHMQFGQPSTGAPAAAIAAAHRVLDAEPMGYWESAPLKRRIARLYAERHGVELDPARVILTCGASPALVLALATAFRPRARVAVVRPGYVAYRNALRALAMQPVEIGCGAARYRLTAEALARIDPAPDGLIVASPANPTGTVIDRAELAAIAAVCAERGIRIVSDEIYHGITYGTAATSLLELAPDAFIVNSFSKYFSMVGWRLGWLVAPPDLGAAAHARMGSLFLTAPTLSQHAGLVAMDCAAELDAHVAAYAANRAAVLDALPSLGLSRIAPPDGAFYIWADVRHLTRDSHRFCADLLEATGVATAPGIDFDPVDGAGFLRFSFAVSAAEVAEGLARMRPFFARAAAA